jgi:hypothetical protein
MIRSNQGKVWTSKLESRINNFMLLGQKINCRSGKDTFNQEVQQQWQQSRHDTSVEEFAQNWNFLCKLQNLAKSNSDHDRLSNVDQNLDDIKDFVEEDTDFEENKFETLGREKNLKRKRVSLCRHKLQGRAYPKVRKVKTILGQPQPLPEQEDTDLDHEWLQLIQMERTIEEQKNKLLKTRAKDHWDLDEDREIFWETAGSPVNEQDDHLHDGDLEYINAILNSFSKQNFNHENSNGLKIESFTPEDALTCALAPTRTQQQFNLKFNQNSTSRGSNDENFSYFSNVEEEGPTDLGNYFSDDEEDLSGESDPWSHTDFYKPENFPQQQHTLSDFDSEIFGLETINEESFEDKGEANNLNGVSCLSEETKLAFSTWRLFIPPEHAFRNCAAQSQPSGFSSQASSSQEPTLIQISTITTSTKLTPAPMKPTSPRPETSLLQPKDWPSFKPATRPFTCTWTKLWTESTKTYNETKNWRTEFPDHPEPSGRYRCWKRRLQCSNGTNQNQSTRFQNMPQVTDAGSEPQVCTQLKSRNYSTMKPKRSTTKIKSWETKWHKFSNTTPTYRTKLPKSTKPLWKNSRKTQLWLWS